MKAMLMVLLLLVAALLFITACGEGVIGEQRAPEDETEREPFVRQGLDTAFNMVGLLRVDTNGICTGTLIAPSVVLTAYHCRGTTVTFQAPGMSCSYKVVAGYGSRASDWAVLKLEADVASGKPLPLALTLAACQAFDHGNGTLSGACRCSSSCSRKRVASACRLTCCRFTQVGAHSGAVSRRSR